MFDAIFYAVMVGSMIAAAATAYNANEKAKEQKQDVYTYGDPAAIVEMADVPSAADVPEIVITD